MKHLLTFPLLVLSLWAGAQWSPCFEFAPMDQNGNWYFAGRNKGAYLPVASVPRDTTDEPRHFYFTEGGAYIPGMYDTRPSDTIQWNQNISAAKSFCPDLIDNGRDMTTSDTVVTWSLEIPTSEGWVQCDLGDFIIRKKIGVFEYYWVRNIKSKK